MIKDGVDKDSPFCRPHLHLIHRYRRAPFVLCDQTNNVRLMSRQVFRRIHLCLSNWRGGIHATVNREMLRLSCRTICQRQFRVKCIKNKNRIAAARSMNELCKMWSNIDVSASLAFIDTAEMAWPTQLKQSRIVFNSLTLAFLFLLFLKTDLINRLYSSY